MHNATAITTGTANQRPNTPCIRLWIDVTFRGLEDSYMTEIQVRRMGGNQATFCDFSKGT